MMEMKMKGKRERGKEFISTDSIQFNSTQFNSISRPSLHFSPLPFSLHTVIPSSTTDPSDPSGDPRFFPPSPCSRSLHHPSRIPYRVP